MRCNPFLSLELYPYVLLRRSLEKPTGCLGYRVGHTTSSRRNALQGATYEQFLDKYKSGKLTAVDEVMINAPPSGFALKVGNASLNKYMLLLTLTFQHCFDTIVSPE